MADHPVAVEVVDTVPLVAADSGEDTVGVGEVDIAHLVVADSAADNHLAVLHTVAEVVLAADIAAVDRVVVAGRAAVADTVDSLVVVHMAAHRPAGNWADQKT